MVYIFLADGFEEAEALVPVDLLRRAGIETAMVGVKGELVTGSHHIQVKADMTMDQVDLSRARMLVLPGGSKGVAGLEQERDVAAMVQVAQDREIWVAAICAAPTLLAKWGILKGKRAVCYPGMEELMVQALPQMDRGVVTDGKLITGRAAGSAISFGLALVAALEGEEKARQVAREIHHPG